LPTNEQIDKASVGIKHLELDETPCRQITEAQHATGRGGIAKGYAAEEALAKIRELGISRALVRASGDIAAGDPPPGEKGWKIGLAPLDPDQPPERFIWLKSGAVSTSGDSRQHLIVDGKRYSHIIDPHTGYGIAGRSSVSVIAPRGIDADSIASAVSILGPEKGLKLVETPRDGPDNCRRRGQSEVVQFRRFAGLAIVGAYGFYRRGTAAANKWKALPCPTTETDRRPDEDEELWRRRW
jgi:thiamine biosynthesis lipoprotein